MRLGVSLCGAALAATVLCGAGHPARAQDRTSECRPQVRELRELLDEGAKIAPPGADASSVRRQRAFFEQALEKLRATERTCAAADLHFLIAYALEWLGRDAEALQRYSKFVAESNAQGVYVDAAKERIATLTPHVVLYVLPEGATIELDGKPIAKARGTKEIAVAPGRHVLRFSLDGHEPRERIIQADVKDRFDLKVTLSEVPHRNRPKPRR